MSYVTSNIHPDIFLSSGQVRILKYAKRLTYSMMTSNIALESSISGTSFGKKSTLFVVVFWWDFANARKFVWDIFRRVGGGVYLV